MLCSTTQIVGCGARGGLGEALCSFKGKTRYGQSFRQGRAIASAPFFCGARRSMSTTKSELTRRIRTCLSQSYGEETSMQFDSLLTRARPEFGDYQCNIAMSLAKQLKVQPRSIAEELVKNLKICDIIDDVNISGPGFINLKLADSYVKRKLSRILLDSSGRLDIAKLENKNNARKRVVVDFSSPNIAKEMHVGHLRSTIIGDCISRLLEFKGHHVKKINHVGDWGTQFGMLIHYMRQKTKSTITADVEIDNLVHLYKNAKKQFDASTEFQDASRMEVWKLQNGDHDNLQLWKNICSASRIEFQTIYDMLNIENLEERGESYYNTMMPGILQIFEEKNMLVDSDGASCVFLPGYSNRDGTSQPLILRKSDGGFLYATSDMAAIRQRVLQEKADRIIYVTDSGQAQHFKMIFDAAYAADLLNRPLLVPQSADSSSNNEFEFETETNIDVELKHVPFGLVLGEDGKKFKTRSGEVVKLKDLLEKSIETAEKDLLTRNGGAELNDEERQAAKIIGIGSVKYADLCMNRESNYRFSYAKMLSLSGNTAPFMMYAYVRIRGIQRKAMQELVEHSRESSFSIDQLILESDTELSLAKQLIRFPEVLADVEKDLYPHILCDYLFELSQKFNQFYEHCHVINASSTKLRTSRTGLCIATADTLELGMKILGIETLESL